MTPKDADGLLDLMISTSISLADDVVRAKYALKQGKDVKGICLTKSQQCAQLILNSIDCIEKEIAKLREKVPTGLKPNKKGLVRFDSSRFDYLKDRNERLTFDDACYALATWVWDDRNKEVALEEIKKAFGLKVYKEVQANLKQGNHDT